MRDLGDSEVGGFGITACEDLLFVEDFRLVRQASTGASVAFEDQAVADFFDHEVDRGLRPEQFARIWIHTHPGNWAEPSPVDEATFRRVFARTDWAVMAILAREGRTYARLRFEVGPGSQLEIPVGVDYGRPFPATDHEAWREEYEANVHAQPGLALDSLAALAAGERLKPFGADADGPDGWPDFFEDPPEDKEPSHGNDL